MADQRAENSLESLKIEVSRLSRELDQTQGEKVQAAKYGMGLLEENSKLQERCSQLEELYEVTKNELDLTKTALSKTTETHKITEISGIQHEENLLSESAALECSLNSTIIDLEGDLKLSKQELERLKAERDRTLSETGEIAKELELIAIEKAGLKKEVKEMKFREARLLKDCSDLEEENISLQKQVSVLKSSQVEFEGAKHEIQRLLESAQELQQQVEELSSLKRIAEQQMEEALQALQLERENRYALKKELDAKINSESIMNLSNLALSLRGGLHDDHDIGSDSDGEDVRLPEEMDTGRPQEKQVDLFSEIHLNQMKKLEKQLEGVEGERNALTKSLKEIQDQMEKGKSQVAHLQAAVATIMSHIEALNNLKNEISKKVEKPEDKPIATTYQGWFTVSGKEIDHLKQSIVEIEKSENSLISDVASALRVEMTNLKEKLLVYEMKLQEMEIEMRSMDDAAADAHKTIDTTQGDLNFISEELANLYYKVCNVQGVTAQRVMLDHMTGKGDGKNYSPAKSMGFQGDNHLMVLISRLRPKAQNLSNNWEGDLTITKQVETISEQVKILRSTVLSAVEATTRTLESHASGERGDESIGTPTLEEIQKQLTEYRALVESKTEQNAALRSVLKANKSAAERALANLKAKYDTEKIIVSETMVKLRNELRLLKEDAATFSSLRAMFAARCEEYSTQVDELQRQLSAAEEEKKTLNQLLKLAVQQKLELNQRLEAIELDREMKIHSRRHQPNSNRQVGPGSTGGGPRTGGFGSPRHNR
ncbi:unnamed protein product [Orchesella dallaii]|uniref:Protein bicaudal D n=1 Tax=Orchesella dallaii TaxID=48710 RepID=A0ABP1RM73_9HEXA